MDNSEIKNIFRRVFHFYDKHLGDEDNMISWEALNTAYEKTLMALEQEPCEDAIHRDRTVQDFADKCRECGREKVLDKISEEVEQIDGKVIIEAYVEFGSNRPKYVDLEKVLRVIEKYKEESD